MIVKKGEIIGFNNYEKDGKHVTYAQFVYESSITGYSGKRACASRVEGQYKIGQSVKVLDDFRYPQIIEE